MSVELTDLFGGEGLIYLPNGGPYDGVTTILYWDKHYHVCPQLLPKAYGILNAGHTYISSGGVSTDRAYRTYAERMQTVRQVVLNQQIIPNNLLGSKGSSLYIYLLLL